MVSLEKGKIRATYDFGLATRNERGERFVEFFRQRTLAVTNTLL